MRTRKGQVGYVAKEEPMIIGLIGYILVGAGGYLKEWPMLLFGIAFLLLAHGNDIERLFKWVLYEKIGVEK